MIINSIMASFLIVKIRYYYKRNEDIDYPLILIAVSMGLQMLGLLFKLYHFWVYSRTGEDLHALEVVSRVWNLASDLSLTGLFIMLSKGWGVSDVKFVDNHEAEIVLGGFLLVLRYIWVLLGFFLEYRHESVFHIYDGVTGKLELLNTIIFYIWFYLSIKYA